MSDPGDILDLGPAWHYRLDSIIGQSTYGEVWQATWQQTGSTVAVKVVNRRRMQSYPASQQVLWPEALRRETQLLRMLGHHHLVRFQHHGEYHGLPVLVMEQLTTSLENWLKMRTVPLPGLEALEMLRQAASGLAFLHSNGLRHLDVKPQNLLLSPPGPGQCLKIADLGTARGLSRETAADVEHPFAGSAGWLAPEQILPCRVEAGASGALYYRTGAHTDVYGLGLLLFYLLTGESTEFNQEAASRLRRCPRQALNERDFLAGLAQAGLSVRDEALLTTALGKSATATLTPAAHCAQAAAATWLPGNDASHPPSIALPASADFWSLAVNLLRTLLAAEPVQRPADASVAGQLINRALFDCP